MRGAHASPSPTSAPPSEVAAAPPERSRRLPHRPGMAIQRQGKGGCQGCAGGAPCGPCAQHSAQYFLGGPLQRPARAGAGQAPARPLEPAVRRGLEASFGRPLDHVRVATGEGAERAADALEARAFTLGSTISFGRGEYRPHSAEGRRLLAHEVAHVVQQEGAGAGRRGALAVGDDHDPAEHAADRAADAVMRGERASPSPAPPALRRQRRAGAPSCTGTRTGDLTARVQCGDRAWEVTATPVVSGRSPATQASALPGLDDANVFLEVTICRGGNEVRITPSVNLPRVVQDAVGRMIGGGGLGGISVEPRARISWTLSRTATVTAGGGPDVDLGTGRATGGRVDVGVGAGPVDVGGFVLLGPGGQPTGGGGTVTVTPGRRTPEVDCSTRSVELRLRCREVTRTPGEPARPATPERRLAQDPLYFFFEHASAALCGAGAGGATRCTREGTPPQARLDELVASGARVTSIQGFTSPEGPRAATGGFVGNDELSRQRAQAAGAWLREHAPSLVSGTFAATGESELYSATTRGGRELEGEPLTGHATEELLAQDPLRPTGEAERERLRRLSRARQQDAVYPLLRRAVVQLERVIPADPGSPGREPGTELGEETECPEDVAREARRVLRRS